MASDPTTAVAFPLGREGALYANPYTGEVRPSPPTRLRDFMRIIAEWHRFLGRSGDGRPVGKAINGACNLAFCFLAVSGLCLWWPRSWSWRGVKAVAIFNWRLSGRARDFNWHNAIGLWCAPVLIVLTLTALPLSYRWAGNLIYTLAGEDPPAPPAGPGAGPGRPHHGPKPGDARPAVDWDAQLAAVRRLVPDATLITLDLGGGAAGRPVSANVRQPGAWPRTATTTLTLDPDTGAELKREGFASLSPGRQIRTWARFLHTGQALGWAGQLLAGLACLGGVCLVCTGLALSWRRFFGKPTVPKPSTAP